MNEDLLNILEKAYKGAMETGTFIIQETNELIQEFFMWRTYYHIGLIVLFLFISIGIPFIIRRLFNKVNVGYGTSKFLGKRVNYNFEDFEYALLVFILCVSSFGSGVAAIVELFSLIKLIVAPKIYLIEYLLSYMN